MRCSVCGEIALLPPAGPLHPVDGIPDGWPSLDSECPGPDAAICETPFTGFGYRFTCQRERGHDGAHSSDSSEGVPLGTGEDAIESVGATPVDGAHALTAGDDGDAANSALAVAAGADGVGLPDDGNGPRASAPNVEALDRVIAAGIAQRASLTRAIAVAVDARAAVLAGRPFVEASVAGDEGRDGDLSTTDDEAKPEHAGGNAHPPSLRRLRQPVKVPPGCRSRVLCREGAGSVDHDAGVRCQIETDADRAALCALRADVADVLAVVGRITNDVARAALCEALARSIEVAS